MLVYICINFFGRTPLALLALLVCCALAAGCSAPPAAMPTPRDPAQMTFEASALKNALATRAARATSSPSMTPSPNSARVFLIAVGDNGKQGEKVGCGDSLVPVQVAAPVTGDRAEMIRALLELLLSSGDRYAAASGLYNAFKPGLLRVDTVRLQAGQAIIALSGDLPTPVTECNMPRMQAQLEQTAAQFPQVRAVTLLLNGQDFTEALSGHGNPAEDTKPLQGVGTPSPATGRIFMVMTGDNGKSGALVGCGDSLVAVTVSLPAAQEPRDRVKALLAQLLSAGDRYATGAGLYNALKDSDLKVDSVQVQEGRTKVALSGTIKLGGQCDGPRFQAQLEETVRQILPVNQVQITLNGKSLKDALSGR